MSRKEYFSKNKKYIVEKSYILASLICTKEKYFKERYVTLTECNQLTNSLRKRFEEIGVDVLIVDEIDSSFFNKISDLVILNRDIELDDIRSRYLEKLPLELISIIWDDEFIYQNVYQERIIEEVPQHDASLKDFQSNNISLTSLDKLIEKIVENPGLFYEKVAHELSESEYDYIMRLITNKTCNNCKNDTCKIVVCASNIGPCSEWLNDEMIGKRRFLIK